MPQEDSGAIPLTRDGGFKMVSHAIRDFERETFEPMFRELTRKIDTNDQKTDNLYRVIERVKGAIWAMGLLLAAPGIIVAGLEIYKAVHQ